MRYPGSDLLTAILQEYDVPKPSHLKPKEEKHINLFLLFREQLHDGPLYTHARTRKHETGESTRVYGQEQLNNRYATTSKANVDPFLAVPTYSQRFHQNERALPDLASQPIPKRFFPEELHKTLDGADGPPTKRRKTAKVFTLSKITSLRTAEEVFLNEKPKVEEEDDDGTGYNKMIDIMTKLEKDSGEGEAEAGFLSGEDDDDWVRGDEDGELEAEDQYDDEDDNDYNAEQYFDDGAGDEDDDGGDDDVGTY